MVMVFYLVNLVNATSLAMSPATIEHENMVRGGYAETKVRLSTTSNILNFMSQVSSKDGSHEWVSLDSGNEIIIATKSEPKYVKVMINIPLDVPNGDYESYVSFRMVSKDDVSLETGVQILPGVTSKIKITVSDQEIKKCKVISANIQDAEISKEIVVKTYLENQGNVFLSPDMELKIYDLEQNLINSETINFDKILPTVKNERSFEIENTLEEGQYWTEFEIDECGYNKIINFDVLGEGSKKALGQLIEIIRTGWMHVGQITPITVVFRNTGEKKYSAKFKGTIELDGEIVKLLESEELEIGVGENVNFDMFFEPEKPGRYALNGRVYYDNKKTSLFQSSVNVNPKQEREAIPEHFLNVGDISSSAKSKLEDIMKAIENGEASEVYRTVNLKPSEDSNYGTKVTLLFRAEKDADNMMIVEVLPKSIVESTDDIKALDEGFVILEKDPIFYFDVGKVKKGDLKKVSYLIKEEVKKIDVNAVAVNLENSGSLFSTTNITIVLLILIAFLFFKRK